MDSQKQLRGIAAMLVSGAVFMVNDSLMKLAISGLPPYEVLVLRGAAGIVFAYALLWWRGEARFVPQIFSWPVLLRALLECVAILTYIIALAHAPLGDVVALFQTTPLLVILGLVVFQGEASSPLRLMLVVLGFVGALLVAQPGQGTISPFIMLAFISAVFAAVRDLAARKISAAVPALMSTFVLIVVVFCGAFICGMIFETWQVPPVTSVIGLTGAGFMMMLGHHFTMLAYRLATAQAVAPFYYSFMVFAVIAGYLVFGDVPNLLGVIGMGVIVASGLAIMALERKETARVFQSADL